MQNAGRQLCKHKEDDAVEVKNIKRVEFLLMNEWNSTQITIKKNKGISKKTRV